MHKNANTYEIHPNLVMWVFIGKLSLSTLRRVSMCQGFNHFSGFLHGFVLAKAAISSIRVKYVNGLNSEEHSWHEWLDI